jgi:anti-sigma B factor antagonist
MDITIADHPGRPATVVAVHGELSIDGVARLRTILAGLIDNSITRIVVDLGPMTFCDSIGLSAFVDAHRRCAERGGYLRLAAASPFLRRVLGVVGLLGPLSLYDTVAAACAGDLAGRTSAAGDRPAPIRHDVD